MIYPHLLNAKTAPVRWGPIMLSCLSLPLSLSSSFTGVWNWKQDNSAALVEVKEWRRALLIWLKWECGQRSEAIITANVLCTSIHTTDKAMPGAAEPMLNSSYCNQSRRHVWNVSPKWAVLFQNRKMEDFFWVIWYCVRIYGNRN